MDYELYYIIARKRYQRLIRHVKLYDEHILMQSKRFDNQVTISSTKVAMKFLAI